MWHYFKSFWSTPSDNPAYYKDLRKLETEQLKKQDTVKNKIDTLMISLANDKLMLSNVEKEIKESNKRLNDLFKQKHEIDRLNKQTTGLPKQDEEETTTQQHTKSVQQLQEQTKSVKQLQEQTKSVLNKKLQDHVQQKLQQKASGLVGKVAGVQQKLQQKASGLVGKVAGMTPMGKVAKLALKTVAKKSKFGDGDDLTSLITSTKNEISTLIGTKKDLWIVINKQQKQLNEFHRQLNNINGVLKNTVRDITNYMSSKINSTKAKEKEMKNQHKKYQNRYVADFKKYHFPHDVEYDRAYKDAKFDTLYQLFTHIRQVRDVALKQRAFADGVHVVTVIPERFEIAMFLEYSRDLKTQIMSIRFRRPDDHIGRGCLRLIVDSWERDVITIDNVDMLRCKSNSETLYYCYVSLAILLCAFLGAKQIHVKDWNNYTNDNTDYREQNFIRNKEQLLKDKNNTLFSHDFSYFSKFDFIDMFYNNQNPLIRNGIVLIKEGTSANDDYKLYDGNDKTKKFFLMHRIAPKVHEAYLKNVSLQGLEKFEDLCTRLSQCTDGGDFCKDAIFDALKLSNNNTATETDTDTETATETDTETTGAAFGRHRQRHHRQRRPKRRSKRIQRLKSRPNYKD